MLSPDHDPVSLQLATLLAAVVCGSHTFLGYNSTIWISRGGEESVDWENYQFFLKVEIPHSRDYNCPRSALFTMHSGSRQPEQMERVFMCHISSRHGLTFICSGLFVT